ncbi:MAG: DKNYY domain-containing protein [Bdellovibrionaceae bacterium]|nr:DKNYY domain-containing protein [Pseudobdellovibrionaceae bacterium]
MQKSLILSGLFVIGLATLLAFQNCGKGYVATKLESNSSGPGGLTQVGPQESYGAILKSYSEEHCGEDLWVVNGHGYHVRENSHLPNGKGVFYYDRWMPQADPETFRAFNDSFARDKDYLYSQEHTLETLNPGDVAESYPGGYYLKLHGPDLIFYDGEILHGDFETFVFMPGEEDEAVDRYGVYNGTRLTHDSRFASLGQPGSDLTYVGGGYFRRGDTIYFYQGLDEFPIYEADPDSFRGPVGSYLSVAIDKNYVYYQDYVIFDSGLGKIETLGSGVEGLWTNGKDVFYWDERAGPFSGYANLGFGYSRVGRTFYRGDDDVRYNPDPETFKPLSSYIAVDKDRVWSRDRTIDGATPDMVTKAEGALSVINDTIRFGYYTVSGPSPQTVRCLTPDSVLADATGFYTTSGNAIQNTNAFDPKKTKSVGGAIFYDDIKMTNMPSGNTNSTTVVRSGPVADIVDPNWTALNYIHRVESGNVVNGNEVLGPLSDLVDVTGDLELVYGNKLYYGRSIGSSSPIEIKSIDLLGDISPRFYLGQFVRLGDQVFWIGNWEDGPLSVSDSHSFVPISDNLWYDNSQVYYDQDVADGVAPVSVRQFSSSYWSAGNKLYYQITEVTGGDPTTFHYVGATYGADKNQLYCMEKVVNGIDPNSFKSFRSGYYFDNDSVVYGCNVLTGEDPQNFKYLSGNYYGGTSIYYNGTLLANSDPSTFTQVPTSSYYYKDKNNVYYYGVTLAGADPAQFTLISGYLAKDDDQVFVRSNPIADETSTNMTFLQKVSVNYYLLVGVKVYWYGSGNLTLVTADSGSIQNLNGLFYKDATKVFYQTTHLVDADAATFTVDTSGIYAKDGSGNCYVNSSKVTCTSLPPFS